MNAAERLWNAETWRNDQRRAWSKLQSHRCGSILVPMDLSAGSDAALQHAIQHAKTMRCRIVVLHVLQTSHGHGFLDPEQAHQLRADRTLAAERQLHRMIEKHKTGSVPIEIRIRSGIPEYEILKAAFAMDAKMIVMGREHRGALSRLVFGSVCANVLDASPFPVLIVTKRRERQRPTEIQTEIEKEELAA